MSNQTLANRELKDVWVVVAYPNMKPGETLQSVIDNFVFETEQIAKEEAQRAVEQDHDSFWGFSFKRKSLVMAKEPILAMSAFREKLMKVMVERGSLEAQTMTMDSLAGHYASYFKSGNTFEDWFKEWSADL